MAVKAEKTESVIRYAKGQILKSKRFSDQRDLLGAILEDEKAYSLEEVDAEIDGYKRKAVK